jgi:hypothetical protein
MWAKMMPCCVRCSKAKRGYAQCWGIDIVGCIDELGIVKDGLGDRLFCVERSPLFVRELRRR